MGDTQVTKSFRIDKELEKMCNQYCEDNHIRFSVLIKRSLETYIREHSTFDSCNS